MRYDRDSEIEERLIEDALAEHVGRVEPNRDLWPGVRDRLSQRNQSRFSVLARAIAATAIASLLTLLMVVLPWSLFDETMAPFAAVAHAYEGLFELETVKYRVDGSSSLGNDFSIHNQVDLVSRIDYAVASLSPDSDGNFPLLDPDSIGEFPKWESIVINGKSYTRFTTSDGEQGDISFHSGYRMSRNGDEVIQVEDGKWMLEGEMHGGDGTGWKPFGHLGGSPWSHEDAEDQFDKVELVGMDEIDGQPAVHYRGSKRNTPSGKQDLSVIVIDGKTGEHKPAKIVYRETDVLPEIEHTVDLWVEPNDGRLLKIDWTQVEKAPTRPADFEQRDWCQGLGEFTIAQYNYRRTSDPATGFQMFYFDAPEDSGLYDLLEITCWNGERSEGRVVWGRTSAEEFGEEYWIRWIYTFTAFNEPLDLPTDLPE